jgi:predicted small secreted protein
MTMTKLVIAAVCSSLIALSGCGNTVRGMKQDGVQTSHALDDATHRIAKANAN